MELYEQRKAQIAAVKICAKMFGSELVLLILVKMIIFKFYSMVTEVTISFSASYP